MYKNNHKHELMEIKFTKIQILINIFLIKCVYSSKINNPPLWDNQFMFIGSVETPNINQYIAVQGFYNWSIPAMTEIFTNNLGQEYIIIHHKYKVYRYNPSNDTCCWCTNSYSCGNGTVAPPKPNLLQTGNTTKYIGQTIINDRACNGQIKTEDIAEFRWWTSVSSGIPCQMAQLLGFQSYFVFSYYTNLDSNIQFAVFQVPNTCINAIPDPNYCSISVF